MQIKDFAIVGGASANLYLRGKFEELCDEFGSNLHLAKLEFCSDNAAMIGRYAVDAFERGEFSDLEDLEAKPKVF
jgi:N6-L-threonylcarbamoyladenine synthase